MALESVLLLWVGVRAHVGQGPVATWELLWVEVFISKSPGPSLLVPTPATQFLPEPLKALGFHPLGFVTRKHGPHAHL